MEKTIPVTELRHFIECPHCHKDKVSIDHLLNKPNKQFGPWYCDECGNAYKGVVNGKDVFIEKIKARKDKCIVFLKKNDILLAVEGMYFDGELDQDDKRYYYEEGTCPTNYFKDVLEVIDLSSMDRDPHGIFEFVGAIPFVNLDSIEDIKTIIPNA